MTDTSYRWVIVAAGGLLGCMAVGAMFALPVVRRPGPKVATVLGGGYLASGVGAKDRMPVPHLPAGLKLDPVGDLARYGLGHLHKGHRLLHADGADLGLGDANGVADLGQKPTRFGPAFMADRQKEPFRFAKGIAVARG